MKIKSSIIEIWYIWSPSSEFIAWTLKIEVCHRHTEKSQHSQFREEDKKQIKIN